MNRYGLKDGPLYWHWEGYTVSEIAVMLAMDEDDVRAAVVAEWRRLAESDNDAG